MNFDFISLLLFLWFIRDIKYVSFWLYLWQLKQYHSGRFLSHFKTEQGKKLISNPLQIAKILLIIVWILTEALSLENISLLLMPALFLIYFVEMIMYFRAVFYKRAKFPKFTRKVTFLFLVNLFVIINFPSVVSLVSKTAFGLGFAILLFDVLIPVVVSGIVLLFQPISYYYRLSLQKKAKIKINNLKSGLKIIAIVGSYGKTSTKEYLNTILSAKYKVLSMREHQNTEVGIPLAILNDLRQEHEIFIAEIGAYDKGTIKRTCEFLQPNIGLVTGVNEQHLSLFGSMDNLLSAEGGQELLECLPKGSLLVVNGENNYCMDLYNKANIDKIAYTFNQAQDVIVKEDSVSFSFNNQMVKLGILGKHNVLNLLGAIQIAIKLGMSAKEIAESLKRIDDKQNSLRIYTSKNGVKIIDSTYSSNPDGVIADLDYLNIYPGKKVVVMPCLIELGKEAGNVHNRIGEKIARICDLAIITTADFYQELKNGAMGTGMKEDSVCLLRDVDSIISKIISVCGTNDVVLLEGRLQPGILTELKK